MWRGLVVLGLLTGSAAAQVAIPIPGEIPVVMEVGDTKQVFVRNATGWFCDDPSLLAASLGTGAGGNYWTVTGTQVGSTHCRVGTQWTGATYVFAVTIQPARPKRP